SGFARARVWWRRGTRWLQLRPGPSVDLRTSSSHDCFGRPAFDGDSGDVLQPRARDRFGGSSGGPNLAAEHPASHAFVFSSFCIRVPPTPPPPTGEGGVGRD